MAKRLSTSACVLALSIAVSAAVPEVVVVVSTENPVERLSRGELTDIYLGRLEHFPHGERAIPIDQAERSPAHDRFYREYLGRSAPQVKAHWSRLVFTGRGRPPRAVPDGEAVVDAVAGDPRAIGYLAPRLVDHRLRIVAIGPR